MMDTFTINPESKEVTGMVYDRLCDLKPYLKRLANNRNQIAQRFAKLQFIVDIFHCEKHTLPKCFHQDLEKFSDVRKMNMEICEQANHLLNPLKQITRNMTLGKR